MNSNAKWFAIGAATCAGCFMLGGMGKQPDEPRRLVVDELIVKDVLYVGTPETALWTMRSNGASAELSAVDRKGGSSLLMTVSEPGVQSVMAIRGGADPNKLPDLLLTSSLMGEHYTPDGVGMVGIHTINAGRTIRMLNKGEDEIQWVSEPTKGK